MTGLLPPLDDWQRVKPIIERALPYTGGTHTIEDIEQALLDNSMTLLAGERCAMILEIITYPRLKVLHIFLGAGDLTELRSYSEFIDRLASDIGASRITIAGRRGFVRALKDLGYDEKWSVVAKDI